MMGGEGDRGDEKRATEIEEMRREGESEIKIEKG